MGNKARITAHRTIMGDVCVTAAPHQCIGPCLHGWGRTYQEALTDLAQVVEACNYFARVIFPPAE